MPSLRHEGLVELIRQHPPLATELVRLCGAYPLPGTVTATLGSADTSDVAPVTSNPMPSP
jgi:hypothetical protein